MMTNLPPGSIILLGALILPWLPRRTQAIGALLLPALSLAQLLFLSEMTSPGIEIAGLRLLQVRVDRLSLVFGYIFHIAAFIAALYALHVRDTPQHVTAMGYVGSAIGAVLSADLVTMFIYWEITALASAIWAASLLAAASAAALAAASAAAFSASCCPLLAPALLLQIVFYQKVILTELFVQMDILDPLD